MSIISSFDNKSRPFINPNDFYRKSNKAYKTIIVTFSHKLKSSLTEKELIIPMDICIQSVAESISVFNIKDTNLLLFFTNVGAPITVGLLHELIYIYDIKNVVMFGSCGILDKSINECELIIPTSSYRDEGTSYHYVEPSDYIEIKNSRDLIGIFEELKIPYRNGKIWTTDAMYRETINNINKRKEEGCIAVEMEISAVQALCSYLNINYFPFIYGADRLDENIYNPSVLGNLNIDKRLFHYEIAKKIALIIDNRY